MTKIFSASRLLLLALALSVAPALALTGCEKSAASWRPGMPLAKEDLLVGVIHVADVGESKSGYAYTHELGVRAMQQRLGLKDEQIIRKFNIPDGDHGATEHALRECIARGARLIIATSWGHQAICAKLAEEFPGVVFANATGIRRNEGNFTNGTGRIYQARYLSGIVAGLRTRSGKIGYVAAMGKGNSEVTSGLNAFALGVESVNPQARIYVRITHRWFDPNGEAQAARALLASGCDLITQHCNTAVPLLEAQAAGNWGIGYNSDMQEEAPKAVITSVVWNWGIYYSRLAQSLLDGSFSTQPYLGDLKDGMVDITPLNVELAPDGAAEAVAVARRRMESGEFDVFQGRLTTNDGRVVGEDGRALPYGEIAGGMNWYYRNVIEQ